MREIQTPRLLLCPYRDEEAEEVYAALLDSQTHLAPFIGLFALRDRWHGNPAALLDLLRGVGREMDKDEFAIRDRKTRRLLGGASIIRGGKKEAFTELGYWLLKDALGQGYATEAVSALADDVLRDQAEVYLEIEPTNLASIKLAERLGFVHVGPCEIPWPNAQARPGLRMVKIEESTWLWLPTHQGASRFERSLPWIYEIEPYTSGPVQGQFLLSIPDTGGHSQAAKVHAQEGWTESALATQAGIKKTWNTAWQLDNFETAQLVIKLLCDEHGGRVISHQQYFKHYRQISAKLSQQHQIEISKRNRKSRSS